MATVLVVEDNAIVARDLQSLLRRLGHAAPTVVASGEEAIEEAVALRPDLVLMDVGLRGTLDGIEAAHEIRARLDVPVVFMTALSDDATLARAWEAEPFGYIVKPLELRTVRAAIEMGLYAHRLRAEQRERERWYLAALGAVSDAVLTAGVDLRVTSANPAAEALLGRAREALFGRPLEGAVPLRGGDEGGATMPVVEACARVLASGQPETLAAGARLLSEGGGETPVCGRVTAITSAAGRATGVVVVLRACSAATG